MCPGGEGEAEAVMVEGVDQPFAVVESAISFIWTLSEYCQLLDQLPLGKEAGWSSSKHVTDPWDPYFFGPPGSRAVSQRSGSGFFYN